MISTSVLVSLVAFFAAADAAPQLAPRAGGAAIDSQCTNPRLSQGWFVADCLTGSGDARITSGTNLLNKIGNNDGKLIWQADGYYSTSCNSCKFVNGGAGLNCQCRPNFGGDKDTTLNLNEHIGVYSGHLLSNTKGAPVVPTGSSKYPYPSDVTYGYGGNATCQPGAPMPTWCHENNPKCTNADRANFDETPSRYTSPIPDCIAPAFYFTENKFQFDILKMASSAAWELTGYADPQCKKKVVVISPEMAGQCQNLKELVKGVTARPLFNGDPN